MASCSCLKIFAALLGPLAWILQVSALGTSNWLVYPGGWSVGFFTYCWVIICTILPAKYWSALVGASAGLLGFGLALSGIGCILTWVSCCCCQRKRGAGIASGVFYILGALMNIVSVILYAIDMPPKFPGAKLGSSFIVAIVAAIFCIIAAILIIVGANKQAREPLPVQPVIMMQPQQVVMQPGMQQGYVAQQPGYVQDPNQQQQVQYVQ